MNIRGMQMVREFYTDLGQALASQRFDERLQETIIPKIMKSVEDGESQNLYEF